MTLKRIEGKGLAVEHRVLRLRGQRVMLDRDMAWLYGVELEEVERAVAEAPERFPEDFAFRLEPEETAGVLSGRLLPEHAGPDADRPPLAFTELGLAMLSSVLENERAVAANLAIMRAFVLLRHRVSDHAGHRDALEELEAEAAGDQERLAVLHAIRALVSDEPVTPARSMAETQDPD